MVRNPHGLGDAPDNQELNRRDDRRKNGEDDMRDPEWILHEIGLTGAPVEVTLFGEIAVPLPGERSPVSDEARTHKSAPFALEIALPRDAEVIVAIVAGR